MNYVKSFALLAFRDKRRDRDTNNLCRALARSRETIVPSRKLYPLLVNFDDIRLQASLKQINPDNLAAALGDGYAQKSIMLEIADAPVTQGKVEAVLPWLGDPAVMENPNLRKIPLAARKLRGGFLRNYRAAQERFLKDHRQ